MKRYETQSQNLFEHANRSASLFCSGGGIPCATIPFTDQANDVWPLRSPFFRDWLAITFSAEFDIIPGRQPLRDAIRMLESFARRSKFPRQSVDLRVAPFHDEHIDDAILIDLATTEGDYIEITPEACTAKTGHNYFRRTQTMLP